MKRILIANRGEVVLRIIRTARELGIETVVVYSEADKNMEYLEYADDTVQIGPAQASKSYLNVEAIISAAIAWKANAIHPGYGFLSENPVLASRCEEHGIEFIGPTAATIRTIGNKSRTKEVADSLGIPTIPGSFGVVDSVEHATVIAREIGLPVMIKSLYGGGGRGMKICYDEKQLKNHFLSASSEAEAAFGRKEIYIERYVDAPRHLEVQVLADRCGNVQVMGDRECSIQRRHQKVIEEAPIPNIAPGVRESLWEWSRNIIRAIGFRGLGTVEFLMDQDSNIYFLEINGRLQVEHPVTEMVTGLDLIKEQIMVAAGARVSTKVPNISGHAIECRLNAEDPNMNFMPTTGTVRRLRLPDGPGVRVDTHLFEGCVISPFYDSLLAKVLARHSTRSETVMRMVRALNETHVQGVVTNKELLNKLLHNTSFINGNTDTTLVKQILNK